MIIKLVRHGQSLANTGEVNSTEIGDCNVALSSAGLTQARQAGESLGPEYVAKSLIYHSPYLRARQTMYGIFDGANVLAHPLVNGDLSNLRIYEDIRLREIEFGFHKTQDEVTAERTLRQVHGWMFYRYRGGESPADCFDRTCSFIDSMYRQIERKNASRILVVTHGMTLRCFVTRFLHLTVEQFADMRNPHNGDMITITDKASISDPAFVRGKWAVTGLRLRSRGPATT
jgi:broad specificity phosphatase PhoE